MATNKKLIAPRAFGNGISISIPDTVKDHGELKLSRFVRGCAWNICEFLASSTPFCEVEGFGLKCQPIVVGMHYLCCQGASLGVEVADSIM